MLAIVSVPAIGLIYLTVTWEPTETVTRSVVQEAPKPPTTAEIVSLVNDEREKRGVAPLGVLPVLNKAAKAKANDLVEYRYFEHANPYTGVNGTTFAFDLLQRNQCYNIGENLAQGFTTPKEAVEAWLASPGHRKAMLHERYELTGVAVVKDYRPDGGYIAVQHFCDVDQSISSY